MKAPCLPIALLLLALLLAFPAHAGAAPAPIPGRGPIALPPRAHAPDKTIPAPIAQRTPPSAKGDK